jgi:hypothetical protein
LAEPFIGKLKNLSRRHYKISRSRPNKIPGEKGTRRKCQNKMNKSFLLSGGRKNDRFGSGFKPATLPDLQNGNAKEHWTKPQSGIQRAALSRAAGISIEPECVAT